MKHLIEFNYQVTKNRGLINADTTLTKFLDKIKEELTELETALNYMSYDIDHPAAKSELADIVLVCLNMARHYDIDIEKQLLNNILKNSTRQ
jgi:NTP pyrophosphatase (non-canonical NTP hydrolase)